MAVLTAPWPNVLLQLGAVIAEQLYLSTRQQNPVSHRQWWWQCSQQNIVLECLKSTFTTLIT